MPGNIPNVSRNTFDFAKQYGPVILQQGVPIHDSDWNEMMDNIWIRGTHVVNHATVGECRLKHTQLDGTTNSDSGMQVIQHPSTPTNDFTVTDGGAIVAGVFVPSTAASPPQDFDYNDQVMFTGAVTAVGGGDMTDSIKNWSASHSLTNCRVKMTSGTESGNWFTITALVSATSVTLSGGTGAIAATDTYEIYPPALTTPSGSDRDDLVYLHVFFDDIATEEDSTITHPGTSVEAVHKSKIVAVVRVLEGSTTMPTPTEANLLSYGHRYLEMATLERLDGNSSITTAMITNADNIRRALTHVEADTVAFDDTVMTGKGYAASTYVQDAVDNILNYLDSSDGAGVVRGATISDSPNSCSGGTLQAMLTTLLGHINDRVETYHPSTSPSNPVLVWRSHNITSNANVTGDTVSLYISNVGLVLIRGAYLDSTYAYEAPVSPEAYAWALLINSQIGFYRKTLTGSTQWGWNTNGAWDFNFRLSGGASYYASSYASGNFVSYEAEVYNWYYAPSTVSNAMYVDRYYDFGEGDHMLSVIQKGPTLHYITNAYLDTPGSGDTVKPNSTSIAMASLQLDGDSGLIRFLRTTTFRGSYASGHGLASSDFSAKLIPLRTAQDKGASEDYCYSCFEAQGYCYEEIKVDNSFKMTRHSSSGASYMDQCEVSTGYNFRSRWFVAPTTVDVTGLTTSGLSGSNTVVVSGVDNWGFRLLIRTTPVFETTELVDMVAYGNVEVYI